ncbi:MAG: Crp/Fnr family transcriptional regulator [Chitinophagaceae bacterium]|nr:Crp/Fnr family transcriptional regulator [Chitinophagaceae bacterium]
MLQPFYNYMNDIRKLDADVIRSFDEGCEYIDVARNEYLLRDGEVCNYLYIITEGLVRMYYIKEDEEISSMFLEPFAPFTAPDSFYSRKPGYMCLQAVVPTRLARIHYHRLQQLYDQHPDLNYVGRVITERYFVKSEERLQLLRKQSAEERYQYFAEAYPELLLKIPLKYIASYLGITNETLSRIRNKIRK